jgi:hypothetical protein
MLFFLSDEGTSGPTQGLSRTGRKADQDLLKYPTPGGFLLGKLYPDNACFDPELMDRVVSLPFKKKISITNLTFLCTLTMIRLLMHESTDTIRKITVNSLIENFFCCIPCSNNHPKNLAKQYENRTPEPVLESDDESYKATIFQFKLWK